MNINSPTHVWQSLQCSCKENHKHQVDCHPQATDSIPNRRNAKFGYNHIKNILCHSNNEIRKNLTNVIIAHKPTYTTFIR